MCTPVSIPSRMRQPC